MKKALIASSNLNKAKELRAVSSEFGIELMLPEDLKIASPEIVEDGESYFANALIKAKAYAKLTELPVISDDSGLEVEILGNKPGINSARFASELTQENKNLLIINQVQNAEKQNMIINRTARFVCSVVLYFSEEKFFHQEGEIKGKILDIPRGKGGFGYDPIVLIDSIGKTLAEIDFNLSMQVGFRAKATRNLFNALDSLA